MASLSATTLMLQTLFLSSWILLSPTNAAAAASDHLIKKACKVSVYKVFNDTECVKILTSFPKISSASDFSSLEIAIIETAINNITDVITFIRKNVNSNDKIDPYQKGDLETCVVYYKDILKSFKGAVAQLKHPDPKHRSDLDLDLGVSSMYIQICQDFFRIGGVFDSSITTTNKVLQLFIEAADNALTS